MGVGAIWGVVSLPMTLYFVDISHVNPIYSPASILPTRPTNWLCFALALPSTLPTTLAYIILPQYLRHSVIDGPWLGL
jgi:hypothetical protein